MKYLCDSCRHAKPAPRCYYQTQDGRKWSFNVEYVRCAVRKPLWTVEKRKECWDYEQEKRGDAHDDAARC